MPPQHVPDMEAQSIFQSQSLRRIATVALIVGFLASAAPAVVANHASLDRATMNDRPATREDDGEVVNYPGSVFHGMGNQVTFGGTPGDGGMFLDARLSNLIAPGAPEDGIALYPGAYLSPLTGNPDILVTGRYTSSAWYGQWNDLNGNGRIDDIHDAMASGGDEFRWRGVGSGESDVAIVDFVLPRMWTYTAAYGPRNYDDYADPYNRGDEMLDRTGYSNAEQEWVSREYYTTVDGGFLTTIQHITVAGATRLAGNEEEYDIHDPAALVDVDRYTGLGPDVQALYLAAADLAYPYQYTDYFWSVERALLAEYVNPTTAPVLAIVNGITGGLPSPDTTAVTDIVWDVQGQGADLAFDTLDDMSPLEPKEPNTAEDDYQGRALFGGIGDIEGSYNVYPGYQDSWHLFFTTYPRTTLCAGVAVDAVVLQYSAIAACQEVKEDPVAGHTVDERSSQLVMSFRSKTFLWWDENGDATVGYRCDPTSSDGGYDPERNTCDRYDWSRSDPYWTSNNWESHGSCATATAKGGVITVTPVGAEWENAVVVRDHHFPAKTLTDETATIPEGSDPVTLRWLDACEADGYRLKSRDAIVFLTGETTYPLRVETRQSMNAYEDVELGIENHDEYVVDVDYIPPVF